MESVTLSELPLTTVSGMSDILLIHFIPMSAHAVTFSDFLRKPKQVVRKVDKHDVLLVRTGGKPSLRLSLESRASAASMVHELGMKLAADAVASVPEGAGRAELMARHFPWVRFLPEGDRALFERNFVETLQACVSLGNFAKLDELLGDWKTTALAHADPELAADLKRPIPAGPEIPVPRPPMVRPRRAKKR